MKNTNKLFFKKSDLLLLGVLVALAVGLFVYFRWGKASGGQNVVAVATIGYGAGQTTQTIPLHKEGITYIDNASLPVQLEVKDGAIRFVNSVCPDHKCENFGWLRQEGDWAACIPGAVSVTIVGE